MIQIPEDVRSKSDEEILILSAGAPAAFEVLVDRYEDAFVRKAESILRRREDAEDVVQEAFVKIYLNARRFKVQEGASFKSWGYKILINTCLTKAKKLSKERGRTAFDDDPEFMEHLPDTSGPVSESRRLDLDEFFSVVSRIPVVFARLLKQSVVEGKSSEQIAAEEGVSVGAIRTRLHRAKKEFQKVSSKMKSVLVI
jgi:RNA polymerase sigma-70 factor (ECF subfamily)